jgi:preprotein translocase subunit SecA
MTPSTRRIAKRIARRSAGMADITPDPTLLTSQAHLLERYSTVLANAARVLREALRVREQAVEHLNFTRLAQSNTEISHLVKALAHAGLKSIADGLEHARSTVYAVDKQKLEQD